MHVMSGEALEAQIGGLLVGLAAKGTTVEERPGPPASCGRRRSGCRAGTTASCSTPAGPGGRAGDVQHLDGGGKVVAAAGGVARAAKHF